MKKNIIALAIASVFAAPVAMANAPTVYGQVGVMVQNVTDGKIGENFVGGTGVEDGGSEIGVKGSQDLGNGLKAIYQLEFGVDATDNKGGLESKAQFVGLSGGFGTVLAGNHSTPFHMSRPSDPFEGMGGTGDMDGGLGIAGSRVGNVVAYVSPSFNGVKFVGAGVSNAHETAAKDRSLFNTISAAVMYGSKSEGLYLGLGYTALSGEVFGLNKEEATEMRLSAQYTFDAFMVNAMYQEFEDSNTTTSATATAKEGSNMQFTATFDMGALTPKIKYSMVDFENDRHEDGSAWAIGLDYALGSNTTTFVEYSNFDKNMSGLTDARGAAKDKSEFVVGLIHEF